MCTAVSRPDVQVADASSRAVTLIRCSREQPGACVTLRKYFIKSESTDSGGSFDGCESDDRWDGAVVHTDKVRHLTTSLSAPRGWRVGSPESSEASPATAGVMSTTRTVYTADPLQGQPGLNLQGYKHGSSHVTGFCAGNISPIFSRLAKDLLSMRTQRIHHNVDASADVPGRGGLADDVCASQHVDHPLSGNQDPAHRPPCPDCHTGPQHRATPSYQPCRHLSGRALPLTQEADQVVRHFTRSMSDFGRRTGSHELSDGEQTSCSRRTGSHELSDGEQTSCGRSTGSQELSDGEQTSCSCSSGDIGRSSLSLDMGISVSSTESLEDRSLVEAGECAPGAARMLARETATTVQDMPGQACFPPHQQACTSDQCHTCSCPVHKCSSGNSAGTQVASLADLTGGLPMGSDAPGLLSVNAAFDKTCCLAGSASTPKRLVARTRRKRDFHSWENHLENGVPEGRELSIYELVRCLDASPPHRNGVSGSSPTPDSSGEVSKHSPRDSSLGGQTVSGPVSGQQTGHGVVPPTQHRRVSDHTVLATPATTGGHLTTPTRRLGVCNSTSHSPRADGHCSPYYSAATCNVGGSAPVPCACNRARARQTATDTTTDTTTDTSTGPASVSGPHVSNGVGSTSRVKSGEPQFVPTDTSSEKECAHTSYLKSIGTAWRRLSSPGKNVAVMFGSNRCKYDVQQAQRSPLKSGGQATFMQKFASTKSSSFDASCLSVTTCHLTNSPSSPVLLSASSSSPAPAGCRRFRSFSVDACRATRHVGGDRVQDAPRSINRSSEDTLSEQHDDGDEEEEDVLVQNWFDAQKTERNKLAYDGSDGRPPKKAQQFGMSLHDIKINTGRIIPLPVEETVEYLMAIGGDEVEGLFRRCARVSTMREVQERYDDGERIDFHAYNDPHLAAAILKKFLRELQEPLMTYDLFEPITRLHYLEASKQLSEVQRILQDELAEDNYIILKYVFQFLRQVVSKADINHMTAENVATVFGPNIAWPKGQANLAAVEQAVRFSLILVQHFDDVFLR